MKYMGWSWEDLQSAPVDIVQEVIAIINETPDPTD